MVRTRWIAIVVLIALLVAGVSSPAQAALFPTNCDAWATLTWSDNCYVGNSSSYDKTGNYSAGIQRILKQLGFYGGTIEGIFGSLSAAATQNYQSARGLTADGVVGSNTWGSLVTELYFVTDDGTYKYYKIGASGPSSIFRMGDFTTDWYMRKLNGTWATNFDTNGPS